MNRAAVWLCPDCGVKLPDGPDTHMCPHLQIMCVPRALGGPASKYRDECNECARRVLVLDYADTGRSWWAQCHEQRQWAEVWKVDGIRAARMPRETTEEQKAQKEKTRIERENARATMAENARRLLETLGRGRT